MIPTMPAEPGRQRGLSQAIRYFLWLGLTGFGGPVALCGLMERDLVEKRGWLDKAQMRDVIAVCQTMPGPLAVQVAIFIGYLRFGFWGAWASGCALILPASVMVAILAAAYVHFHGLPWLTAVIHGVSPAVIALILQSWWRLARLGMEERFQYVIATVALVAAFALPGHLTGMFLAAGIIGPGWYALRARRKNGDGRLHDLASFLILARLAWFFLLTGAFTFGGGLAVVPLLEKELVERGHWLTSAEFLTAIAVGMVTPGPVMTAATFAGYLVAGVSGAAICTIAIYLPSFILVLIAAPPLMRNRDNVFVRGFVKSVYAAAIGAILGATVVLGGQAISDWLTALIAMVSLIALVRFGVSGPVLVGLAAVVGLVTSGLMPASHG